MVKIISDSTCDLSPELVNRYDIDILPLHILLGEKEYKDGKNITPDEIFAWSDAHKTTPKTSAPSLADAIEILKPYVEEKREVICFSISSSMSTSGNVMRLAADELEASDFVTVIDSANLSTGIGLQVVEAAVMAQAGKSAAEITAALEELKPKVRASFVVDTLTYLYRGGRCNAVAAMAGGVLKLHPKIVVENGAMDATKKYRGKIGSVIMNYAKDMEEDLKNARPDRVFITHSGCDRAIVDQVRTYLASLGVFDEILEKTHIPRAAGGTVFTAEEAKEVANRLGYPVLVRPSYVLGGQGMKIAFNDEEIEEFIGIINRIAQDHPILVDKYLQGKEIEVDAVCDGTDILIPGIMEHIERTGVHSGDSISVYPAPTISDKVKETIVEYTKRLAQALHVVGLINIQFIAMNEEVYVIEVNPRSSRTVPYISKVTGIPIVDLATKVIIGNTIRGLGYEPGLAPVADYIAIKMPVFSFEKLRGAEISLGPEMKSTGECLGIAKSFNEALYKAFLGAGVQLPKHKQMIMTVKDADKPEAVGVAKRFEALGYKIYATRSTAKYLQEHGINALRVNKITQESPNVMDLILGHKIDLVIDTPTQGNGDKTRDGFLIRRNAIETGVYCITAMDTANALARSLETANGQLTPVDIATVKNM